MKTSISNPTIVRLCGIYQILCRLEEGKRKSVSSADLGAMAGYPSHTIRKDINCFGEIGTTGAGYEVGRLKRHLAGHLGLEAEKKACIIGLGRLGSAIIESPQFAGGEFRIVAGFDSNINKIETLKTAIPLFPSYEISEVVRKMGITLAIIAVPAASAQEAADRLVEGGVRGIVNFASAIIVPKRAGCYVRNIDIPGELRILTVMMSRVEPQAVEAGLE